MRQIILALCILVFTACTPPKEISTPYPSEAPAGTAAPTLTPSATSPLVSSEDRAAWLSENALAVRSISPDDEDFSDLQGLSQMIGDARIVMLGEPSHKDGAAFLAKVRLIKYLHEELGFDVIAFESGLYDCTRAWEMIQEGEDVRQAFRTSVLSLWSWTEQVLPLIDYIEEMASSDNPLILSGVDSSLTGDGISDGFVEDLAAYSDALLDETPTDDEWNEFASQVKDLSSRPPNYSAAPSQDTQAVFFDMIEVLQEQIRAAAPPDDLEAAFWLQTLDGLRAHAYQIWQYLALGNVDYFDYPDIFNTRDLQMGENLLWLANEYYPEHKIIVWAHSFHIARNLDTLTWLPENDNGYEEIRVMGDIVHDALGEQVYSLGFTAYEGSMIQRYPESLDPHAEISLEDLFYQAGLEYAIADFRNPPPGGEWLSDPLVSHPLEYEDMLADWTQVFDGMMFIRETFRSSPAQ